MLPDYYEFFVPVKILCGKKALHNLPYEMNQLGVGRAMVITDQGVVGAGLMKHLDAAFDGSGMSICSVYDSTPVDSSNKVCNEVAALFRANDCDCLIAVGGGSVLDTAKGVNIVLSENAEDLMQFQGSDRIQARMKPLFAVATTAGTGSEVTAAAVIRDVDRDVKMPFMSDLLYPHVAVVDPVMMMTMPPKITAATGMDALTHAMEAFVNLQKNPVSDAFATAAVDLIFKNLALCTEDGNNKDARLAMANAATLAGIAFSNSMVGIVHALAHATGGVAHVPHGVANAIFLPHGLEFNMKMASNHIAGLAPYVGLSEIPGTTKKRAEAVINAVVELNRKLNGICGLPLTLADAGVAEEKLPQIAKAALNDGSCMYNPEHISEQDALRILENAWHGV